ncbi:hypothetical protein K449DRAFT_468858 [Hypoxylon sp. EC38]|nr:hypothetical protein K449DRAFT_468858 [Hypoxylon sp. EC38]
MRTITAAVSTQFRGLGDALYTKTRCILGMPDMNEQGLSWMTRKPSHDYCWNAFRFIQLSRLYDVDMAEVSPVGFAASVSTSQNLDEDFAVAEERRGTFWLAFCFDRFLNTRNEWPLTLHEEMASIYISVTTLRLFEQYTPEENFQNSLPIRMDFLPEALTNSSRTTHSPFAECIILATLYGRCMVHRRLSLASSFSGNDPHEFWTRHEWLATVLEKQTRILIQTSAITSTLDNRDPMLAFSHMLGRSAIIYLSITTEINPGKGHPFLPNALSDAATFLMAHPKTPDFTSQERRGEDGVEQLLGALRNLRDVNNLARDLLVKLEVDNLHPPELTQTPLASSIDACIRGPNIAKPALFTSTSSFHPSCVSWERIKRSNRQMPDSLARFRCRFRSLGRQPCLGLSQQPQCGSLPAERLLLIQTRTHPHCSVPENDFQKAMISLASRSIQERLPRSIPDPRDRSTYSIGNVMAREEGKKFVAKHTNGWAISALSSNSQSRKLERHSNAVVIVAGAAGSLGFHLVVAFAEHPDVKTVPHLDLPANEFSWLVQNDTDIVHNAWPMSGTQPVHVFAQLYFQALRNLLDLTREIACHDETMRAGFDLVSSIGVVGHAGEPRAIERTLPYNGWTFRANRRLKTYSGFWNPVEHFAFLVKSSQGLCVWPDFEGRATMGAC